VASLSLRQVSKRFGRHTVIDNVTLDIADREFAVLLGPSGCGKSTLLRLIAGLEEPSTGDIFIGGDRVNDLSPRERGIAMVFQSYALYPHMTVYHNIAFGLTRSSMQRAEIDRRVKAAAERLQIDHLLDRKPRQLSGGQRQRVAIGRAIVRDPTVFLFDEPLSNLDAGLRTQMRLEFMNLHRELATTIVYVTHDQAEAMTLASTIIVLREGRIEQVGTPLNVYDHPRNRFVGSFIGSPPMNMIDGRIESADGTGAHVWISNQLQLHVPVDAQGAAAGDRVTVGFRPEHLRPLARPDGLRVTVVAVESLGGESLIHAGLSTGETVVWRTSGRAEVNAGDAIGLELDAGRCHLFDAKGAAFPRKLADLPTDRTTSCNLNG
jgi:multiple sugar transport system ATP-binding protein